MRRVLIALGLIAALAGCSSHESGTVAAVPSGQAAIPVPQVTETHSPRVTHSPQSTRTTRSPQAKKTAAAPGAGSGSAGLDRFVAAVREQLPAVVLDRRDEEVEELGERACDGLSAGRSSAVVAGEIGEQGVAAADARKLVALAGDTVCGSPPKV
jgi:hypothetical protein